MGSARPPAQGSLIAPPERGRLFQAAATAAGLAAFAVAYFWPLLRSTEPRSFGSDFAAQTYPSHRYVSAVLSEGRLPHWAPEIGFGFPLLADIETNVLYPIGLLFSLFVGPNLSFRTLELQVLFHHVIGGLGMSLLLRRVGCQWLGALCGALVFGFSGFLWAHAGHFTIVQSASWIPWVLLGGIALAERLSAAALVGTAVALALSILGGHPQMPFYGGVALLVIVGAGAWRPAAGRAGPRPLRLGMAVAAAGLLALGLTAVQLLPTVVLTRYSPRWLPPPGFLKAETLPPENLLTLLIPLAYLNTPRWVSVDEFHGYVGVLPLVLALWALTNRRDRWTYAFAILAGVGLVAAIGPRPFHWVAQARVFRAAARALLLFDLGIAALAGLGASALLTPDPRQSAAERWFRTGLWGAAAVAAVSAVWLSWRGVPASLGRTLSPEFASYYVGFAVLLVAAALALDGARRWRHKRWLTGGLLVALLVAELLTFPRYIAWNKVPPDGWWPALNRAGALPRNAGPHRMLNDGLFQRSKTMEANAGLIYHVPLTSVYTSLYLSRYGNFYDTLMADLPRTANLYDLMAVRWVATRRDLRAWIETPDTGDASSSPRGAARFVKTRGGLWEIRDPLPRAYLPTEIRVVGSRQEVLRALPALDPRRAVILEEPAPGCPPRPLPAGAPGDVRFLLDEPGHTRLQVRTPEAGRALVVSDTYYPGWHATIDGRPAHIYRANFLFRAVCVPAGEHVVEFAFTPPGFRIGLAISILCVAGAALVLVPRGALLAGQRHTARREGEPGPDVIQPKRAPLRPR